MRNEVESILREYTATLLYGTLCYESSETNELVDEYVPKLAHAISVDDAFDSAMLRMRDALARNDELRNLVKVRDERIEKLEVILGRYREIAKYLCGKWDVCDYCGLDCDGREQCELWKLERELGDKG